MTPSSGAGSSFTLAEAKNILVSRLRFLGDLVLVTPLLRAIRESAPQVGIGFLAEARYGEILRGHPDVDELFLLHREPGFRIRNVRAQLDLVRRMRSRRFDAVLDLFANPRSVLLARATGAPVVVGGRHGLRGRLFTHHPQHLPGERSAVAYHLAHLRALGVRDVPHCTPRLPLSGGERERAAEILAQLRFDLAAPLVALHPGASWPGKRWPVRGFAAVGDHVVRYWNATVLVVHGPGEEELAARLLEALPGRGVVLPLLGWRELAAVLSLCDMLLANDGGPMHVAAAVGTATVGIFGPSDPAIWFPYPAGEGHRVVDCVLPCRPCSAMHCGDRECLAALQPESVLSVMEEARQATGPAGRKAMQRSELVGR